MLRMLPSLKKAVIMESVKAISAEPEFPNEIWTLVLARLKDVPSLFWAQAVSRTFHAIILDQFWTKIVKLEMEMINNLENGVKIYKQQLVLSTVWLSPPKSLLLVQQLARKAPRIISLHLTLAKQPQARAAPINFRILTVLASAVFNIEHMSLSINPAALRYYPSFSELIHSVAGTLKSLQVRVLSCGSSTSEDFQQFQAFRYCNGLKSVKIEPTVKWMERYEWSKNGEQRPLLEPVFENKPLLETVDFAGDCTHLTELILHSGARLQRLGFGTDLEDFLAIYKEDLEPLNWNNHPLSSVKELRLPFFHTLPSNWHLDLFPHLEMVTVGKAESIMNWNVLQLIFPFLILNKDQVEKRLLVFRIMNKEGEPLAIEGRQLVAGVQRQLPGQAVVEENLDQIVFTKGNATVKIMTDKERMNRERNDCRL